jgi:murein DD-endopeptidase MepM/ murein hydrolase activator NlpD
VYAHLDDAHMPPTVKISDAVTAGDPIGVIGLTGITTGAQLHFVIRRGVEPIDPSSVLPRS